MRLAGHGSFVIHFHCLFICNLLWIVWERTGGEIIGLSNRLWFCVWLKWSWMVLGGRCLKNPINVNCIAGPIVSWQLPRMRPTIMWLPSTIIHSHTHTHEYWPKRARNFSARTSNSLETLRTENERDVCGVSWSVLAVGLPMLPCVPACKTMF